MKKIILLVVIVTSLFSCSNEPTSNEPTSVNDRLDNISLPQKSPYPTAEMLLIGKYEITSGWLYVYRIGGDTVYVMEGKNQSFRCQSTSNEEPHGRNIEFIKSQDPYACRI